MVVEALVSFSDESSVKTPLTCTRLVCSHQHDSSLFRIERECYAPNAVGSIETHFLHVWVPGAVQRVHPGPSQLRTELLQQARQSQDLSLHIHVQTVEFRLELVGDRDSPVHPTSMSFETYEVKSMF